jgi:hypothetical protein
LTGKTYDSLELMVTPKIVHSKKSIRAYQHEVVRSKRFIDLQFQIVSNIPSEGREVSQCHPGE